MSEKPILFSGHMVKAILSGAKTQTRRIVKPQPKWVYADLIPVKTDDADPKGEVRSRYKVGDRLWVRETWAAYTIPHHEYGDCDEVDCAPRDMRTEWQHVRAEDIVYKADGKNFPSRWRPSIHMPRWASRITLEVTGVHCERLNSITEEDAIAEGVIAPRCPNCGYTLRDCNEQLDHYLCSYPTPLSAKNEFQALWNSIHGADAWQQNPWVFVYEFKKVNP